jgi:FMN phosphatase YigB (HAD superfamily)
VILRSLELPVDVLGTSDGWAVEKPSPAFFRRLVDEANVEPAEILYVGDRVDNDLNPAAGCGLRTAAVRRGPWGYIWSEPQDLNSCLFVLDGLSELPDLVSAHNSQITS